MCFFIAHTLVRRGLVHSTAMTGSIISLGTSAAIFCLLVILFVPLLELFTPAIGQTSGYIGMKRIGVARSSPMVNTSPIFASIFALIFLGEIWLLQNMAGTLLVIIGVILSLFSALNIGNIVRVEPLVFCNPLLTILWAAIFLRQIDQVSGRVVLGALVTVTGNLLVVTAK